jgi:hypothetical protein
MPGCQEPGASVQRPTRFRPSGNRRSPTSSGPPERVADWELAPTHLRSPRPTRTASPLPLPRPLPSKTASGGGSAASSARRCRFVRPEMSSASSFPLRRPERRRYPSPNRKWVSCAFPRAAAKQAVSCLTSCPRACRTGVDRASPAASARHPKLRPAHASETITISICMVIHSLIHIAIWELITRAIVALPLRCVPRCSSMIRALIVGLR